MKARSQGHKPSTVGPYLFIGWRESVQLPDLDIPHINAKVDTGARTSALHADDVKVVRRRGKEFVTFTVHPVQKSLKPAVSCEAELLEYRSVRSSNGAVTRRPVIQTFIELGGFAWQIELTLVNRDEMGFRMLLGRNGVRPGMLVDPHKSFLQSRRVRRKKKS